VLAGRQGRLKLKVNTGKSACARPWERKFLGYSLTQHRQAKLRIAPESLQRLRHKMREHLRAGRGRSLGATISTLNPLLRSWMSYFRLTAPIVSFQMRATAARSVTNSVAGTMGSRDSSDR
jgi:hypothetical protein